MKERCLKTARGDVAYWVTERFEPTRETLVFLHGLTADHRLFLQQAALFASDYNIVAWDAPLHGKSRPYADFSYANAAADLLEILDALDVESAVMIGQSMGGFVVQSLLLRRPERVRAFVAIDSCPYGEAYYSRSDRWWLRQVGWMSRCYPLGALKRAIARQTALTGAARRNMSDMLAPYDKHELCEILGRGYADFLNENRDLRIECPVLLLAGEADRTGKVLAYNRAWADAAGFPLKLIKNAAHNANDDNPGAVNREIDAFLRALPRPHPECAPPTSEAAVGDISIRVATPQDAPSLLEIYAPYVKNTAISFEYEAPSVAEFEERIRGTLAFYPYLLAESGGEVLGYAYARAFHARAAYAWDVETSVYVRAGAHRRGVGRALYTALEAALRSQGILNMNASIAWPETEDEYLTRDSVRFHEEMGFTPVGRFHRCGYKFGRWYDLLWMEKSIGKHMDTQPPVRSFSELRFGGPEMEECVKWRLS